MEKLQDLRQRLQSATADDAAELWVAIDLLSPADDWPFVEPDGLVEIQATLAPLDPLFPTVGLEDSERLANRILGGLYGRFAGCMLGKPLEIPWTTAQIRTYLQLAYYFQITFAFLP